MLIKEVLNCKSRNNKKAHFVSCSNDYENPTDESITFVLLFEKKVTVKYEKKYAWVADENSICV